MPESQQMYLAKKACDYVYSDISECTDRRPGVQVLIQKPPSNCSDSLIEFIAVFTPLGGVIYREHFGIVGATAVEITTPDSFAQLVPDRTTIFKLPLTGIFEWILKTTPQSTPKEAIKLMMQSVKHGSNA